MINALNQDTIVAIATASGMGAIGIVRLSGPQAIALANSVFKGPDLNAQPTHTVHYGHLIQQGQVLDEVLVALFKGPRSFTTEDVVEISCHGSRYILETVLNLLVQAGARLADPGEFTLRAFMHGRIDLSQAEAVADLINATSKASHQIAMRQLRGGFKQDLELLRQELLNFASLIELELDFSEEDVEFADRSQLLALTHTTYQRLSKLADSFRLGNAVKAGVPVVIAGKPNAGKSTLLNALLNEEKAIVSEIAGTTRDVIEDQLNIQGINFRFIDTAGLRETSDAIEKIGVERSYERIKQAAVLVYLMDASSARSPQAIADEFMQAKAFEIPFVFVANKSDQAAPWVADVVNAMPEGLLLSAKAGSGIEDLKERLLEMIHSSELDQDETIVSNARHHQALQKALQAVGQIKLGIASKKDTELLAWDMRNALEALGEITGAVSNDEILGNIFSKFCIGK